MGTTLTGTTPQDTYDSLIKVTDNGPLTGSLKVLTDGLGNDSALALSTGAASVTGTLAVSSSVSARSLSSFRADGGIGLEVNGGDLGPASFIAKFNDFSNNTRIAFMGDGNVGIGNSAPTATLDVTGTLAVSGNATFDTTTLVVDATNNRVGVGVAAPATALDVIANSTYQLHLASTTSNYSSGGLYIGALGTGDPNYHGTLIWNQDNVEFRIGAQCANGTGGITFFTSPSNAAQTEKMRITAAGSVQIGNTTGANPRLFVYNNDATDAGIQVRQDGAAPIQIWQTSGGVEVLRATSVGLTFNGDVAAANALDDYDEGTWTPTTPTSGYTISASNGSYTKIGRQVTIRGEFTFSSIDILSTSAVQISGLPFTNSAFIFSGIIRETTTTGAIYVCGVGPSSTSVFASSMDGVVTASQRPFGISENYVLSVTYFV